MKRHIVALLLAVKRWSKINMSNILETLREAHKRGLWDPRRAIKPPFRASTKTYREQWINMN